MGGGLTAGEMRKLASLHGARVISYNKKETIFGIGRNDGQTGFILRGMVYLCAENELYARNILQFFRVGESVSNELLIPLENSVNYLIAKYPTEILCVNNDELFKLCTVDSSWRYRFMEIKAENKMIMHNFILHQKSIRSRLIHFLKWESGEKKTIRLPMPYSDIADYLSVDRTSMMKEISKMKKEGLISGRNKDITLLW